MHLIPKALVVGVFIPPAGVPGAPTVTADKINRIWSKVAPEHGYRQLQAAPDGSAAQFLGTTPDTGVTIQPPLIQVRDLIGLDPGQSAESAAQVLKTIAQVLGTSQLFNLGVRHVYNVPIDNNDARGFVLERLLGGADRFEELDLGGGLWGGTKIVTTDPTGSAYVLTVEPLQVDEMKSLYVDLDATFPGPLPSLDSVTDRAADARSFITENVNRYLDSL
ncbi:MAG TPA: hypothetical protein VMD09_12830 [Solirubrobacteraceae bacterium]|nr:hypothetical protein [Solirubrobacteraceae bacterium]